ncbi:MAG TPA: NUDIX domain-containing protein [Thermoplasmata archaeon]|nr:NUDIX domain-containing protein [Thermoplasmata archaeon]
MATERRFCRFVRGKDPVSIHEIPRDGFCLSAFLVVSSPKDPDRVLLGHLNPAAPWDHFGAMTADRVEAHRHGWLLPASQLIYGESPEEAAHRIVREQLGGLSIALASPTIVSETYAPKRWPNSPKHWDLEFVFRAVVAALPTPTPTAWRDLAFVDVRSARREEFARSHEEILEGAGFPVAANA